MKRLLLFFLAAFVLTLMVNVASAEDVRIGGPSSGDMLPKKFNPSFNFMATGNAPAKKVEFVYNADQGVQDAGDTCSTNGQMGSPTSPLALVTSQTPPIADMPGVVNASHGNVAFVGGTLRGSPYAQADNTGRHDRGRDRHPDPGPDPEPDPDPPPVVPEPGTMLILGLGLAAALPLSRRLRRKE